MSKSSGYMKKYRASKKTGNGGGGDTDIIK